MQIKNHVLKVGPNSSGETLLAFLRTNLKHFPSVKSIKRAIDAKQCKINGRVEFFSTHPVRGGHLVEITLEVSKIKQESTVLYEDDALIAYNKSPGWASESFADYFLVHRLDKDTSGVILFAKTQEIQKILIAQFAKRQIEKQYWVICDGKIELEEWKIENYLGKRVGYQGGVLFGKVTKERGKKAVTYFKKLKSCSTATLLLAMPITGRTHQIRVHLKDKGHPILGDWQYGKQFKCPLHPPRQMLHALEIAFTHPLTQERLKITAPFLKDFLHVQKSLFGA